MYALKEDLITAKHYDKQFKIDAVQYYHDHKELGLIGCASNLGTSHQSLSRWQKKLRETGDIEVVALVIMLVALKLTSLLSNKISQAAPPIKTY